MRFVLKKERFPVMSFDLTVTPHGLNFNTIYKIIDASKLPLPLSNVAKKDMPFALKKWYVNRMIPEKRIDMQKISRSLSKTPEDVTIDYWGLLQVMSLISYGRNMSDKYWICPTYDFKINTGLKGCGLNGIIIPYRRTYAKLDFIKNGLAQDYLHVLKSNDIEVRENASYNFPDLCTNGKIKKAWVKEGGLYYLEKYYDNYFNNDDIKNICLLAVKAKEEYPTFFPSIELVRDKNSDIPIGYRTPILTSSTSELVTLEDICLSNGIDTKISWENLKKACEFYDISTSYLDDFYRIKESYFNNEFLSSRDFYKNAGFIIETHSKIIIKAVAWI